MPASWAKTARVLLPVLALGVFSPQASARVDGSSAYSKSQTYNGALRYVRVDLGYEVVEKDPDAAYLIFKYTSPGQAKSNTLTGTVEVIETGSNVRLFVNLPRMPEYHERMFRDGLLKKLRDEYGAPPPPPAKKPPEKPAPPPADGS